MFSVRRIGSSWIRGTGKSLFAVGKLVVTIPLTARAIRDSEQARLTLVVVRQDDHFQRYVLPTRYCLYIRLAPFVPVIDPVRDAHLLSAYFERAFSEAANWPPAPLRELLPYDALMTFVQEHTPSQLEAFRSFIASQSMPYSSAHGDFHDANILSTGRHLFFIDWGGYRRDSSRYFDLVSHYLLRHKLPHESWTTAWERLRAALPLRLYGVPLPAAAITSYAVYRTAEMLRAFQLHGELTRARSDKYSRFLTHFLSLLA